MILELKDKMAKIRSHEPVDMGVSIESTDEIKGDALSALINLGYKSQTAKSALDSIISDSPESLTLDVLLKKTLKILAV